MGNRKVTKLVSFWSAFILALFLGTVAEAAGVCRIGKKEYSSLELAVVSAKSGQKITMLKAYKSDREIQIVGKKLVIDFNHKKYTSKGTDTPLFRILPGASLTVRNMNISSEEASFHVNGKLTIESGTYKGGTIFVENAGNIKITGGTFKAYKNQALIYQSETSRGKVVITGGTFQGSLDQSLFHSKGGRFNIHGGTFKAKGSSVLSNWGNVSIRGGEFHSEKWEGNIIASWGKLEISGGKFVSKGDISSILYATEESQTRILGGDFYGLGTSLSLWGKGTISQGTFYGDEVLIEKSGKVQVEGGDFRGSILVKGEAEFRAGKSSGSIYAWDGGKVTIHDFTVELPASKKESCLINKQGTFLVKGGSFTAQSGFGYEGDVRFDTKDIASLFHVKRLQEWED